jgi:primosomal protein N' (replication factor Y)
VDVAGGAVGGVLGGEVEVPYFFRVLPVPRGLAAHDYASFADDLVRERQAAELPPHTRIALLVAEAHAAADVERFLDAGFDCARELGRSHPQVELFPPVPAAMPRRRGYERAQVLAQSRGRPALQAFLPAWREALARVPSSRVRWVLDVDPAGF